MKVLYYLQHCLWVSCALHIVTQTGKVQVSWQWRDKHAAGTTRGTEVQLHSTPSIIHPHPALPLPHISTFLHTDTVTARTDFHSGAHGQ